MKVLFGRHEIDLAPFIKAAVLWALVSLALIIGLATDRYVAVLTWAIYYGLAMTDLYFLVKTVAATLVLMSDQGAENRTAYAIQAFTYGSLKLACLGMIGLLMWKFPNAPSLGILLGLSALVAIPLAGGFWWSQNQLQAQKQSPLRD